MEMYFSVLLGDCGNLFFDKTFLKFFLLRFHLMQKAAELVIEKLS